MSDNKENFNHSSKIIVLKLDNILKKDCYHLTKIVATQIQRHGYASVSKFFKNLPQSELDILLDKIISVSSNVSDEIKSKRYSDVVLLSMTLALAEGKSVIEPEEIDELVHKTILFSSLTNLDRQGKIKANYDLFSFIDKTDAPIFKFVNKETDS